MAKYRIVKDGFDVHRIQRQVYRGRNPTWEYIDHSKSWHSLANAEDHLYKMIKKERDDAENLRKSMMEIVVKEISS